jgi:serine/threonine protein kinase
MYLYYKGSFGVVYEIRNKDTGEKFAMKVISKEKVSSFMIF